MIAPKNAPSFLFASVLLASFAACNATPGKPEAAPFVGDVQRLADLQPGDIAVAPVRNQTGIEEVPVAALREGFSEALVKRLYSPLSSAYVDSNWVESSFRGTPGPDALLVVAMTEWDTSRLFSTGKVTGAAEVVLFEGGSTTGTPLWSVHRSATVELGDASGNPPRPSESLLPRAAELFATQILSDLPTRDPVRAHP
ncbi:MAG TPA: hypothetical protein ENJ09_02970 [Planctomycetes bacterium]|nr:hypothetical protein [Planctomycetota bacterium]